VIPPVREQPEVCEGRYEEEIRRTGSGGAAPVVINVLYAPLWSISGLLAKGERSRYEAEMVKVIADHRKNFHPLDRPPISSHCCTTFFYVKIGKCQ
jgi:hypothetical protein